MPYTRESPSPEYLASLAKAKAVHSGKVFTGLRVLHGYETLDTICHRYAPKTILDYGCGKGQQYEARNVPIRPDRADGYVIPSFAEALGVTFTGYDPAYPKYEQWPGGQYDGVICFDVLSCIPSIDLAAWVMEEIFAAALEFVFFNLSCVPGSKDWVDQEPCKTRLDWWLALTCAAAAKYKDVDWVIRIKTSDDGTPRDIWRRDGVSGAKLVGRHQLMRHGTDAPLPLGTWRFEYFNPENTDVSDLYRLGQQGIGGRGGVLMEPAPPLEPAVGPPLPEAGGA